MALNSTPKDCELIEWDDTAAQRGDRVDLIARTDEAIRGSGWPAGWWILPFTILGIVE